MVLRDKVAVITGSSVGVGRAAAILFAQRGCDVVINYNRTAAEAEETATRCRATGRQALTVQADVSIDADCRRLIQTTVDRFRRIDVLVNNAGVTEFVNFADLEGLTEEAWEKIFRTNVFGTFFCTRAAAPHLKKSGDAAIINIASIAGVLGIGSSIAYAASKAAVINMTKSLARTLGPEIRVNAIAPGAIDTRWLRKGIGPEAYEALRESLRTTTPLQDITSPEDVAQAIVWLAEHARMTTGETIIIDGGFHLGPSPKIHSRE